MLESMMTQKHRSSRTRASPADASKWLGALKSTNIKHGTAPADALNQPCDVIFFTDPGYLLHRALYLQHHQTCSITCCIHELALAGANCHSTGCLFSPSGHRSSTFDRPKLAKRPLECMSEVLDISLCPEFCRHVSVSLFWISPCRHPPNRLCDLQRAFLTVSHESRWPVDLTTESLLKSSRFASCLGHH